MIYLGADHRGFKLKEKLKTWFKEGKQEFEDVGNSEFDPKDDYPDYAKEVAEAVSLDKVARGVVICGSGIGVCMVVNRYKGVRGALGFDQIQVKHGVESDNINVLCLASDHVSFNQAKRLIKSFLGNSFKQKPKNIRRIKKIDSD